MENHGDQKKSTFAVGSECADGMRLDLFLVKKFPKFSRSFFQRCLAEHRVLVNGRPAKRSAAVTPGDQIEVLWPRPLPDKLEPEPMSLAILYEDQGIIVLNKPAGQVVHPASGNVAGTLVNGLLHYLGDDFAAMIDEEMRPGIVHRLDKDTSGIMVVAKNQSAKLFLKQAFKQHQVAKTYLAIVLGTYEVQSGRLETLIGRHPVRRQRMAVVKNKGKNAITEFQVLGQGKECSLLEVKIITGRTHQIRVHCAHIRHPVLGDAVYGGKRASCADQAQRQMLHAWKLAFPHPKTQTMLEFVAPLPEDFQQMLQELNLPQIIMPRNGMQDS